MTETQIDPTMTNIKDPTQSLELDKIATALCKAQAELAHPLKSNLVNAGSMKYSYADLPAVIDAVRTVFAKHGLCFTQAPSSDFSGPVKTMSLKTMLLHVSGQYITSDITLALLDVKPHTIGSAITYARRYALSAMAGIASEVDDDAHAAQGTKSASFTRTNKG